MNWRDKFAVILKSRRERAFGTYQKDENDRSVHSSAFSLV